MLKGIVNKMWLKRDAYEHRPYHAKLTFGFFVELQGTQAWPASLPPASMLAVPRCTWPFASCKSEGVHYMRANTRVFQSTRYPLLGGISGVRLGQ
jgi:hypothetical protein